MRVRLGLVGLLVVATAGSAAAQVVSRYVGQPAGVAPQSVKNAPFSADLITTYDRTLDNGGHIRRETHGRIYRDSQGRVRTETEVPAAQPAAEKLERVTINDPVRQVIIYLNPKLKTATVYNFAEGGPATLALAQNPATATSKPEPAKPLKASSSGSTSTTRMSSTIHFGPAVAPPTPPAAGAVEGRAVTSTGPVAKKSPDVTTASNMATIHTAPSDAKTESLGTRNIEGLSATGTRTTRNIDGGTMGSDKPLISVTESWFSPELKMMLWTETNDGQSGHTSTKLVNVLRTEPGPQLFQVPSDYSVRK